MRIQYEEKDEGGITESMTEHEDGCSGANKYHFKDTDHWIVIDNAARESVTVSLLELYHLRKQTPHPTGYNSPDESELAIRKKLALNNSCVISTSSIRLSLMKTTMVIVGARDRSR